MEKQTNYVTSVLKKVRDFVYVAAFVGALPTLFVGSLTLPTYLERNKLDKAFRTSPYSSIQNRYEERTKEEFENKAFDKRSPRRDLVSLTAEDFDENGNLETYITIDGQKYFLEQNQSGVPPTLRKYEVVKTQPEINLR